jgi:hypothetical protein
MSATTYVYRSFSMSWPWGVGTGITDTNYAMNGQHTAYVTVTVKSPSGRSATNSASALNRVTQSAYIDLSGEDGWFGVWNEAKEWCPVAHMFYYYHDLGGGGGPVDPYVYISSVSADPPSIARRSETSAVSVVAGKSSSCRDGSVSLQVNTHGSPGDLQFQPPSPNPTDAAFLPGTYTARATFNVMSGALNNTAGTISVDGLINSSGCVKDGGSKSTTISVR